MTGNDQAGRYTAAFIVPGATVVLSVVLWVCLCLKGHVPANLVRALLLATPIAAMASLLQPFGLLMNEGVSPGLRARLILMDVAVLLVVGCVLAGGAFLFPEEFQWMHGS